MIVDIVKNCKLKCVDISPLVRTGTLEYISAFQYCPDGRTVHDTIVHFRHGDVYDASIVAVRHESGRYKRRVKIHYRNEDWYFIIEDVIRYSNYLRLFNSTDKRIVAL